MVPDTIAALAAQIVEGTPITRQQAEWLVELDRRWSYDIFCGATRIREHSFGNTVHCCSIVSAKTGRCSEDCSFCSQSARFKTHVQGLAVLEPRQVLAAADEAAANGADSFGIVNSGFGPTDEEIEQWGAVAQRIRESSGMRVCASLGVLTERQAARLAEFGVQRSNHNLQTSRRHFPNIIRSHSYDERLQTLRHLKSAGISVCSGALFGMGETWADRLDLAFELRDVDVDVVPINFLIPMDGTPLEGSVPIDPMECLKIIAVYRFCLPRQEIKIAGGRERNLRDLQSWIFFAGATSFIIGNYLTSCGRPAEQDRQMVRDLGFELAERNPNGATGGLTAPAGHASKKPASVPLPVPGTAG
jgi:biotin synthase